MNTKLLAERGLHLLFAALLTAALLTACSGGGVNIEVEGPDIGSFPPLQTEEAIEARGTITGECTIPPIESSARREYDCPVTLRDPQGDVVVQATLKTLVGPKQVG